MIITIKRVERAGLYLESVGCKAVKAKRLVLYLTENLRTKREEKESVRGEVSIFAALGLLS